MVRGKLSAKQTNEQKWKRMKLIIERLKTQSSLRISEIEEFIFSTKNNSTNRRCTQNYLAELVALGFVTYDSSQALYIWAENRKVLSLAEYQIALNHSRHLLLSDPNIQRLDNTDPSFALDLVAFSNDSSERGRGKEWIYYIHQHIKTGYYEMYSLMQKYKQLMIDLDHAKWRGYPMINEHAFEQLEKEVMSPESLSLSHKKYLKNQKEKDEKEQELANLREQLIGKLYSLVAEVRDTPLMGVCDSCPNRKIIIKE